MSLNDIQLTPQLIAGLYHKTLIGDAESTSKIPLPPAPGSTRVAVVEKKQAPQKNNGAVSGFKSLGDNQKNVLVAVRYNGTVNLPDAQLDFLTQLLKACKLGLMDVAIINMNNYSGAGHNEILEHFSSVMVMLFGITSQEFGFPFEIPEYQVQQFAGKTVVHSPALHEIQDDKAAKGKLWTALKQMFNI